MRVPLNGGIIRNSFLLPRIVTRFLLGFVFLLLGLTFLAGYDPVYQVLIEPWNGWLAGASYWVIQWFDAAVALSGNVIHPMPGSGAGAGGVAVESECNGVEAVIILVAAMLAFPGPARAKALGVVIGAVLVQGMNLLRIISLFYLLQWNRDWFEWFHMYLWPTLIILDALIVFFLWTRMLHRREEARQ